METAGFDDDGLGIVAFTAAPAKHTPSDPDYIYQPFTIATPEEFLHQSSWIASNVIDLY